MTISQRAVCVATILTAVAALTPPRAWAADDEGLELWLNPSVAFELDDDTGVELETAQRLRRESDGREDTYYARLWLNRELSESVELSAGVERRANEPGADETRLLQQVSTRHGVWRTRLRLEQRFVDDARMGLRLRPRLGVELPLDEDDRWTFVATAEGFVTLRATAAGGDTGLTGVRTQVGADWAVNDRLTVGLAYLRQQDIRRNRPDRVGHAPMLSVELSY